MVDATSSDAVGIVYCVDGLLFSVNEATGSGARWYVERCRTTIRSRRRDRETEQLPVRAAWSGARRLPSDRHRDVRCCRTDRAVHHQGDQSRRG